MPSDPRTEEGKVPLADLLFVLPTLPVPSLGAKRDLLGVPDDLYDRLEAGTDGEDDRSFEIESLLPMSSSRFECLLSSSSVSAPRDPAIRSSEVRATTAAPAKWVSGWSPVRRLFVLIDMEGGGYGRTVLHVQPTATGRRKGGQKTTESSTAAMAASCSRRVSGHPPRFRRRRRRRRSSFIIVFVWATPC